MALKLKVFFSILAISLIPTLLIWIPFFFRIESIWKIPLPKNGMETIVANYDGPFYILVSKTLYNPKMVGKFSFTLPAEYYAAHFPLFPLLIRLFSYTFGSPYSMLFVTATSSILAIFFFYIFTNEFTNKKNALWLTFIFSVFPARWLIVRSVGSAEPLFLAMIIASVYFFRKNKFFLAGIFGLLAQLTKSPGILLFIAYFLFLFISDFKRIIIETSQHASKKIELKRYLSISLIPLGLLIVFLIYKIQLKDFFAYFHSGDNIHLFFPPFQIFNYSSAWVGTFWLEEIIFIYLFGFLGLINLINKKETPLAWVVGVFFTSLLFVSHRDLMRYALPIVPFLFSAFSETLVKKDFKLILLILLIPIYLFSLSFISQNVMPVSDWTPLL